MIRCKLVEHFNPDETQSVSRRARAVAGESLSIGRAAACKIYLPDARVRLEHASVRRAEDGYLYLDAAGPVFVDQRAQTSVRLALGQRITLGPYDFVVELLDDGPGKPNAQLTLSFAQRTQVAEPDMNRTAPGASVSVRPGWVTRRRLSWLLSITVLVFASALPIWNAFHPGNRAAPGAVAASAPAPSGAGAQVQPMLRWVLTRTTGLDRFWNPGQLSSAHQKLEQDCRACHDQPFQRVADARCTSCHKRTGNHVSDTSINHSTFDDQRCATCHKEHQGLASMRSTDTIGCAQCHGDIRRYSPLTTLNNVADFARDHPPFRLSIRQPDDARSVLRTLQTAQLANDTGLKFPHHKHLAKEGIKSPTGPAATGGRVLLECASCHSLDAAGVRYAPVRMQQHCQACHRLSVDPQAPQREVPHASSDVVATAVSEIYARLALNRFPVSLVTVNALLQRPAAQAAARQQTSAGRWVQSQSRIALNAMAQSPKGVCQTCHAVQTRSVPGKAQVAWEVSPIVDTEHWLPKSAFSHAQHKNAACAACHDAARSKLAADILIPNLATCQTCHTGDRADQDKVVSRCDSCHGFHQKLENPVFQRTAAAMGPAP